jgi:uncharacterized delta-60 repeat protein
MYSSSTHAASVQLDPTFGTGGKVITSYGNDAGALRLALQSDGKAVIAGLNSNDGHRNWAIARYNTDGTIDTSFGTNGNITREFGFDNVAFGLAIQPEDG